jgi:hypothetical protein
VLLGELLLQDLDIIRRNSKIPPDLDLDSACSLVLEQGGQRPIVYTAFDGDHQQLGGHMRTLVLKRGGVPANPDSILGYKDTVLAHLDKRGVLLDDLAVLRGCDELWVFTEWPCEPTSVRHLAEGVVIELLFFLKRRTPARIQFISPLALLRGDPFNPRSYDFSYAETQKALLPSQRAGVMALANSRISIDKELPPVICYITDPLDFKYTRWLRQRAYSDRRAPLVPPLAVDLQDLEPSTNSLDNIVTCWVRLCKLATYAMYLPSMDEHRQPSVIAALFERAWLRTHSADTLQEGKWQDYQIPKAKAGELWPITQHEGRRRI